MIRFEGVSNNWFRSELSLASGGRTYAVSHKENGNSDLVLVSSHSKFLLEVVKTSVANVDWLRQQGPSFIRRCNANLDP